MLRVLSVSVPLRKKLVSAVCLWLTLMRETSELQVDVGVGLQELLHIQLINIQTYISS